MTPHRVSETPRDLIALHAGLLFEAHGYAGTSVRQIAAAACVDPSLVIRHFGSKELLFLTVIGLDGYADPPVAGPIDSLGVRLARFVLAPEHADFRTRMGALLRASDREAVREGLRVSVRRMFIDQLLAVLTGDDREVRAQLVTAQLGGLVQASEAIEQEVLTRVGQERLVELYGRAIQALVDEP